MSRVTCDMFVVTLSPYPYCDEPILPLWGVENVTGKAQLPPVHVTCHPSPVTCHMSQIKTFGNIGMWGIKNVTGKAQLS